MKNDGLISAKTSNVLLGYLSSNFSARLCFGCCSKFSSICPIQRLFGNSINPSSHLHQSVFTLMEATEKDHLTIKWKVLEILLNHCTKIFHLILHGPCRKSSLSTMNFSSINIIFTSDNLFSTLAFILSLTPITFVFCFIPSAYV